MKHRTKQCNPKEGSWEGENVSECQEHWMLPTVTAAAEAALSHVAKQSIMAIQWKAQLSGVHHNESVTKQFCIPLSIMATHSLMV